MMNRSLDELLPPLRRDFARAVDRRLSLRDTSYELYFREAPRKADPRKFLPGIFEE